MGTPHKHAEVLRAIADGKDVQWSRAEGAAWSDYRRDGCGCDPISYPDILWRIKPKPDVVWYASAFNCYLGNPTESILLAKQWLKSGVGVIVITIDGETGALKAAEVLK